MGLVGRETRGGMRLERQQMGWGEREKNGMRGKETRDGMRGERQEIGGVVYRRNTGWRIKKVLSRFELALLNRKIVTEFLKIMYKQMFSKILYIYSSNSIIFIFIFAKTIWILRIRSPREWKKITSDSCLSIGRNSI